MSIRSVSELWRLSATELAEAIRSRQASSREVVEAHLRRIEAVNPRINAVTVVLAEQALEAATAADRLAAAGGDLPPLHGVPFTVKESIDVKGTATTMGVGALASAFPVRDAPTVERLRAAGALPIGRTNLASFTVRWHTESELYGATINPWDGSRTPGASSGGEAAGLATGMTPLGVGSDGLGSLRWPAQCCGIATLKPTLGRIPNATTSGPDVAAIGVQQTAVVGPLARRIADLKAAYGVMAGPSWRDPWSVPAPLRGPDHAMPIPVAVTVDPAGMGTAKQVQDGVLIAARALSDAGYVVETIEPPAIWEAAEALVVMDSTPGSRAGWEMFSQQLPAESRMFMAAFFEAAGNPDAVTAAQSFITRQRLLRDWGEFQEGRPLIVAPVYADLPFRADWDLKDGSVAETIRGMRMTMAVNALGLPAVAVPVGIAHGLPQVVQVIGPRYREDLCLDAAEAIEDRLGIFTPIDPQ